MGIYGIKSAAHWYIGSALGEVDLQHPGWPIRAQLQEQPSPSNTHVWDDLQSSGPSSHYPLGSHSNPIYSFSCFIDKESGA